VSKDLQDWGGTTAIYKSDLKKKRSEIMYSEHFFKKECGGRKLHTYLKID